MKKIRLIVFILLLSSTTKTFSCGYYPFGEDIRISLFSSNLCDEDDLEPFFYSIHFLNEYSQNALRGPHENLDEWFTYFNGKFSRETIDELIYRSKYEVFSTELLKNDLYLYFKAGNDAEVFEYIKFAKKVEYILYTDFWSDKQIDFGHVKIALKVALDSCKKTETELLKLRYAYQAEVLAYYLEKPKSVQVIYDELIEPLKSESIITTWALFYKTCNEKDELKRYRTFAQIFERSRAKNEYIFKAFPSELEKQKKVLLSCETPQEQAAVLTVIAFKNPARAIDQISKIAELDPDNSLIDLLLVREINKMEDWYFTDRYTQFGGAIVDRWWEDKPQEFVFLDEQNFESDKLYLLKVMEVTQEIMKNTAIKNKGLWDLSMAYMSYMAEDKIQTEKYLDLAREQPLDQLQLGQLKTVEILSAVKFEQEWSTAFQNRLYAQLVELKDFENELYNYERFAGQMMLAISRKCLDEDQVVLAALFEGRVNGGTDEHYTSWDSPLYQVFNLLNEQATSKDMDLFFKWWNKPSKNELEKYLYSDLEPYKWRLTDLWATTYFREDQLEKALKIYETIPDSVWKVYNNDYHYYYAQELDANPFDTRFTRSRIDDDRSVTYTKPEFIREILRLKKEIATSSHLRAYNYMLLGNAYFNMTIGGNSWYMTEYGWSSYSRDWSSGQNEDYYSGERALAYYKLAEETSKDKGFSAFCYRLRLKCLQLKATYSDESFSHEAFMRQFNKKYPKYADELYGCDRFDYYFEKYKDA